MFFRLTLALPLLLLPLTAQAQETYTIKLKQGGIGSTTHVQKTEVITSTIKFADNKGNALKDEIKKEDKTWVYDETILERPDLKKKATGLRRAYEKAAVKTGDDATVLAYQGKTVLIEKKDGKYRFRYENGGEITRQEAEHLDKEFNKDSNDLDLEALMLPPKAVAVNEAWTISIAQLLKASELERKMAVDTDKSSASGKLVKAYKKDGRQFGELVFTLALAVKSIRTEQDEMICQPGTVMNLEMKLSGCIDGSVNEGVAQAKMLFNGLVLFPSADNPEARITISIQGTSEETIREVPKK